MRVQIAFKASVASLLVFALAGCGGAGFGSGTTGGTTGGSTSGGTSVTTSGGVTGSIASVTLLASSSQLPSASSSVSGGVTLTAIVKDSSNNLVQGAAVSFVASGGGISFNGNSSSTDDNGTVTAVLTTAGDPKNQEITVTALAEGVSGSIQIAEVGTTLSVSGPSVAGSGAGTTYIVKLTDSAGNVISNQQVSLTSSLGNPISPSSATTDASGQASFTYTGTVGGNESLVASASSLNVQALKAVTVSSSNLSFTQPASNTIIPFGATGQQVTVHYTASGNPVSGQSIGFSATRGTLSSATAVTSSTGDATVTISSTGSSGAGGSIISASVTNGPTASLSVQFSATNPATITIQPSPSTVSPSTSSTVTAKVVDASQNPVQGAAVDFTLSDTSGGTLSAASGLTDPSGNVEVTYTASTATSAQNGVQVNASVHSNPAVNTQSNPALITVGGQAYSIQLTTTNLVATDPNDTSEYQLPYSVKVQDSAGNPVAAGTQVNLKVSSVSYQKGFYYATPTSSTGASSKPWTGVYTITADNQPSVDDTDTFGCLNEDTNNDAALDDGEVDYNDNGKVDPGIVASVPSTVATDSQTPAGQPLTGTVPFVVTYGKSYSNWVRITLTATLPLGGTPAVATASFNLPLLASDATIAGTPPPGASVQVPAAEYYSVACPSGTTCSSTGYVSATGSPYGVADSCSNPN